MSYTTPPFPMILEDTIYKILAEKLKKLNKIRPLSPTMIAKLRERFEVEMTYNSNAIEGNSLTLKETYWVIQEGITVKDKPLKDHLEAKNHKEALDLLYELVDHEKSSTISEHLIKSFHTLIVQNIHQEIAGQYRKIDVFISGSKHKPPPAFEVPRKMHELILWMRKYHKKMHVIDFATLLHHKFVHIHPFQDGNGRTGRLLMNVFLMHYGFPLVIIQKNDRKKYYRALRQADEENYVLLTQMVSQAVLRSVNIYLDVLTPSNEKTYFELLSTIVKKTPFSAKYLNKLARLGKIDAHKEGRNWLTTKQAVDDYIKAQAKKNNLN